MTLYNQDWRARLATTCHEMSDDSISLSARYNRALSAASSLSNHSALSDEYKSISSAALSDLKLVSAAIHDLQLFSKNETLEDISTRQLIFLSVPYATGELLLSLPAPDPTLRKDVLVQAEVFNSARLLPFTF